MDDFDTEMKSTLEDIETSQATFKSEMIGQDSGFLEKCFQYRCPILQQEVNTY